MRRQPRPRRDRERGAALVEMALVTPLLLLLLFGIIDFGWAYTQQLDTKHGAREAARLVAVNYRTGTSTGNAQADALVQEACRRMDGGTGVTVTLQVPAGQSGDVGSVGQYATVTVSRPGRSLSGVFGPILDGTTWRSSLDTRLEVKATWATSTAARSVSCTPSP